MKILVTGARGQLGLSLAKIADEFGWASLCGIDLPEGDITDRDAMRREMQSVDVVINCAAWTAVDAAEANADAAAKVNTNGVRILAELAAEMDAALVHISTDYVFDGTGNVPITEIAVPRPLGVYGVTKLAGEEAVMASGARAAVVRTAWLFSEFGNNFVRTMLRIGKERGSVRVVNDQYGSPTYAEDLARAVMGLVERGIEGCETYHYCNKGTASWYEFARAIFRDAGMSVTVEPISTAEYPTAAQRPAYSVLDTTKISALGIPVPTWEDALKKCLEECKIY